MICFVRFVALCISINVAPAFAETVQGESRELGIRFLVIGGSNWCGPQTKVRLTASSASSFKPDELPFLQMVGRIRAVLLSQCPEIEEIAFDGFAENRLAFAAETSRLTRWRQLVALDPATHQPLCPTLVVNTECAAQTNSYLIVRALMRGSAFADAELTNAMRPDSGDLTFRSNNVVGKFRTASRADFAKTFATAGEFAAAILTNIGEGCAKQGDVVETGIAQTAGPDLAKSELTCRPTSVPAVQNVVLVWAAGDQFRVFSLWAEDPARTDATIFADRLITAIRSSR